MAAAASPTFPSVAVGRPLNGAWRHRTLYLFVLPFASLTVVFGLWPIVQSIQIAFMDNMSAFSDEPAYVGLENFRTILADPSFIQSLWKTLLFTVVSVVVNVTLALALALFATQKGLRHVSPFLKLAIFLPVITPDVASFIVWKWMFNQDFGAVNAALLSLGLPPFAGVTTGGSAFATLLIVELWHHVGPLRDHLHDQFAAARRGASTRRRRSTAPIAGSGCCTSPFRSCGRPSPSTPSTR